jgi:hypothetical protein
MPKRKNDELDIVGHRFEVDRNGNITATDSRGGSLTTQSVEALMLLCILRILQNSK